LQAYLSIVNSLILVLPIYYFCKVNHSGKIKIYLGIAIIVLYGVLECVSFYISKIFILFFADMLLLFGVLVIFKGLIKLNVYKRYISNPLISTVIIFMFLLGTSIMNNLFYTPYLIITFIYYVGIATLAHIYQIINRNSLQIPETLLIISIIICYIYDTLYFSGKISLQEYLKAPWFIQYLLQSLSGIICFVQVRLSGKT
jgi:hypothetical protein